MWEINSFFQVFGFFCALLTGLIYGMVYDAFRAVRKVFRPSVFHIVITDILFSCFAAFSCFCLEMSLTEGQIRLYFLFGIAFGFFIERYTVSRFIFRFYVLLLKGVRRAFNAFSALFWRGFDAIEKKIGCFIEKTASFFKKVVKYLKKLLKKG